MDRTQAYYDRLDAERIKASTIASAIEINRPVNLKKCLRALDFCQGVVREVSDQEIMDAKARVGSGGLGCEPASAASVAGARRLREEGIIAPSDRVVCILTGHQLKDPTATVAYHGTDQENFEKVLGKPGRPPRRFRQSPGRGRQRPRRHHPDDRPLSPRGLAWTRERTRGLDHCPGGFPQLPRCDRSQLASGGSLF